MAGSSELTELADVRRASLKAQALECIAAGLTIIATAAELGITRETLYDWRTKDPEFSHAWNESYTRRIDHIEDVAFKRAADGNDQLLMFLLRGGRAERYGDKRQLTIDQNTSVDVRVLRALPIEDLLQRLTALRDAQRGLEIDGNVVDLDARRQLPDDTG